MVKRILTAAVLPTAHTHRHSNVCWTGGFLFNLRQGQNLSTHTHTDTIQPLMAASPLLSCYLASKQASSVSSTASKIIYSNKKSTYLLQAHWTTICFTGQNVGTQSEEKNNFPLAAKQRAADLVCVSLELFECGKGRNQPLRLSSNKKRCWICGHNVPLSQNANVSWCSQRKHKDARRINRNALVFGLHTHNKLLASATLAPLAHTATS